MPGMLMSDSTTISSGRTPSSSLPKASSAEAAKCITYWPCRTSRRTKGIVKFYGYRRTGGNVANTDALKFLKIST